MGPAIYSRGTAGYKIGPPVDIKGQKFTAEDEDNFSVVPAEA